jgi:hypothetical protein
MEPPLVDRTLIDPLANVNVDLNEGATDFGGVEPGVPRRGWVSQLCDIS